MHVPLQRLSACLDRIGLQCETLRHLAPHLARHGVDLEARSVAAELMRDFELSVQQHHAHEEQDLFAALIESMAGSDAVCLRELTAGLAIEHREIEARWRAVRAALARIVAGTSIALAPELVEALVGLCEQHLDRERRELLPMAARLLTDADLARLGAAMSRRQGAVADG